MKLVLNICGLLLSLSAFASPTRTVELRARTLDKILRAQEKRLVKHSEMSAEELRAALRRDNLQALSRIDRYVSRYAQDTTTVAKLNRLRKQLLADIVQIERLSQREILQAETKVLAHLRQERSQVFVTAAPVVRESRRADPDWRDDTVDRYYVQQKRKYEETRARFAAKDKRESRCLSIQLFETLGDTAVYYALPLVLVTSIIDILNPFCWPALFHGSNP